MVSFGRRYSFLLVLVVATALWVLSIGGAQARDHGRNFYITPSGYRVPVYGMGLDRRPDGTRRAACTRLNDVQIERSRWSVAATRANVRSSVRASVQAAPGGLPFSIRYTDPPGRGFNDAERGAVRRAAMETALAAWSSALRGSVPVVVQARMEEQEEGTLAAAGPTDLVAVNGRLIPLALAAQLLGASLNAGDTDIEILFNEDADWDFVLNGANSPGRSSFVYTAIHEICHGLGFLDSFDPDTGRLSNALPTPYDAFVSRGVGGMSPLLDRSAELVRGDLVSADLFFSGPNSMRASVSSIRPLPMVKLHAPSSYQNGSSISHVDQDLYADVRVGLMTPSEFDGPGTDKVDALTAGIMADLGYQPGP